MDSILPQPSTRAFDDTDAMRERIFSRVQDAHANFYPIENAKYRLELADVRYGKDIDAGYEQQKKAIIGSKTLHRPLLGTWKLVDVVTGALVDARPNARVAMVPYLTGRGTFIYNGNEYTLANQMRLKPGVYTRKKENDELESHFNIMPGSGPSFRVQMNPETGVFNAHVGQSKIPLYTILRSLGIRDAQMAEAWGRDLLAANQLKDNPKHLNRAHEKFTYRRAALGTGDRQPGDITDLAQELREVFDKMQLDPEVTRDTLGYPHDRVSPEVLLKATQKLVGISRGEVDTDDRDNISYQTILGPEDLFAERVSKDAGRAARNLLWRTTWRNSLDPVVNTDVLTKRLQHVLLKSGLGQPLEETNPLDIQDQLERVSRMGAGGIPSTDAIPDEARTVQPSYLAFIDPVRTPESSKAGVDSRVAYRTMKGDDGQLYTPLITHAGNERMVPSSEASRATIAFPGEIARAAAEGRKAKAMVRGRMRLVDPAQIDYEVPSPEDMMSSPAHLIPFLSALKGHRMLMGTRMLSQSLALRDAEAPLVQTRRINDLDPDDSFEKYFGGKVGAVRADGRGVVKRVTKNYITVEDEVGNEQRYPLYSNFPFNRRAFIHNTPAISAGQSVRPGMLLAKSNFTDAEGALALGRNLRIGYLPYRGMTFEDAIVISESAAKKLTSEHMYQHDMDLEPGQKISKSTFLAKYPTAYPKALIDKFDDSGVIKPGSVVKKNDPLVLSVTKRAAKGQGTLHRSAKSAWMNTTETWKHDVDGVVTDVHRGPRTVNVVVKSYHPTGVGDKLSSRHASKGVISAIIPDAKMPHDEKGRPLEILAHPYGVISRSNPSLMLEAALGKVAAKIGRAYNVSGFSEEDLVKFVSDELKKHRVSDTEDLFDPEGNRKIPKVFVGNQFWMKLHHTAESKLGGRGDEAGYTADMIPGKGKGESSKRLGQMETTSLLSSGATSVLRDAKLIRGQRNDDFWRAFRMGYPPPTPEVPFVYRRFLDDLKGAGINVRKEGNYVHIMALTDKDIDKMSRGKIEKAETLDFDTMDPIPRGLFDLGLTGSHGGRGWSHIDLSEPMPNPVMEEPIRRLLGLTKEKFRKVLSGEEDIDGLKGGRGIQQALRGINVERELEAQKQLIRSGPKSKRDLAIKRLRSLTMFKETGIKPSELVLTKVPVLPPQYRPTSRVGKTLIDSHPNYLYKELMLVNDDLAGLRDELGDENVGQDRLALYDTFKALTGLGDPVQPKLQEKHVRGILAHAIGIGASPKQSAFQRKVIGTATDLVGRGVVTPNASLSMDQVGLPEEKAWVLYRPFVVRRLVRRGVKATDAAKMASDRDPRAREALLQEMEQRPVIVNRAPTLHRFGIMAAYPILTKGNTLQVSPITTSGFGMDFDGDAAQFHVPVSDEAVQEAKDKLLPSRNLTDVRFFDVHYVPAQEYLHGLYTASSGDSGKPVRMFRSDRDVIQAYRRGEIGVDDRVQINE